MRPPVSSLVVIALHIGARHCFFRGCDLASERKYGSYRISARPSRALESKLLHTSCSHTPTNCPEASTTCVEGGLTSCERLLEPESSLQAGNPPSGHRNRSMCPQR